LLRRTLLSLLALAFAASVTPSLARSSVVFHRTDKYTESMNVLLGLLPGHTYRVNVWSPTKHAYQATGSLNYLYVANKVLHSGTSGVNKKGTTPASFLLKGLKNVSVRQWTLGLDVALTKGHGLSVKVTDLGMKK
jgi:hypothetical protein